MAVYWRRILKAFDGFVKDPSRHDDQQDPVWTAEFDKRGGVFEDEEACANLAVSYHPLVKRYLMTMGNAPGAWGIYDAPEPWGPWTTVFHTAHWDVGDTHTYQLPTKWMASDHLYVVFSGRPFEGTNYDSFCVRRLNFTIASDD